MDMIPTEIEKALHTAMVDYKRRRSMDPNAKLMINSGWVINKLREQSVLQLYKDGNLTIENGEFVGNIHAIYVYEGNLVVNGGNFSVQQPYSAARPYEYTLNCYDANRMAGTAAITVNGGSFYKFDPSNCYAEGAGTNFVATGHTVSQDGDYFVVE